MIKKLIPWLLPAGVIVGGFMIASVIRNAGPEVQLVTPEPQPFVVRVVTAVPESAQLEVESQGSVEARYDINLVSQLPGAIGWVSPAFVTGGRFEADEVLLKLDATDYELARISAAAQVAEAEEELEVEKSEAELAAKGLFPLREAKVASAQARLESALADLAKADADLARTEIRAPFAGRVLFTQVDLGQYVGKGEALGRVFSTDFAEVRLPLTDEQLGLLKDPFSESDEASARVSLSSVVGGETVSWEGSIKRIESAVDPDNRVWFAVASVPDPYGSGGTGSDTPLAVGLFVDARIQGREVDDVYRLPRTALRRNSDVLLVDGDNRLRRRQVQVLRTGYNDVLVAGGIQPGERICVSPVEVFVDGLTVTAVDDQSSAARNGATP